MSKHGERGAQIDALTDEFIDSHAIVGPPEHCVERILELMDLGVEAMMVAPRQSDSGEAEIREGQRRVVEEVLPAVRTPIARCATP